METPPIALEARLQTRYHTLLEQHSTPPSTLASGLRALPDGGSGFAATQAAWRFFANPKVTLPALCQPLQDYTRQQVQGHAYVLVVHDWSWLDYNGHTRKKDRIAHSHSRAQGYDLLSALAVSTHTGAPLAPLHLALSSAEGVYSSQHADCQPAWEDHPHALWTQISVVETLGLPARCVHCVDREGDSVALHRQFAQANRLCLLRARDNQYVEVDGQRVQLRALCERLSFTYARPVVYQGHAAQQYIAHQTVTLTRPYIRARKGQREVIAGPPVGVRLVISQVRSEAGVVLACWYLLTNVPDDVPAPTLALWYYWRWQIECYHKLLKKAGWQLEEWQQESAAALVKRLAVVAMASALVWAIQHCRDPQIDPLRRELIRLSGRQMKRRQPVTAPALLAGLGTLLAAVELLERYTPDELQRLAQQATSLMGRP